MAGLDAAATALFSVKMSSSYIYSNPSNLQSQAFSSPFIRKTKIVPLRLFSAVNTPVTNPVDFKTLSSTNDVDLDEAKPVEINQKRKLYVVNLPPFVSGPFVTKIFSQCGVVQEVEVSISWRIFFFC